jgi:UDP-N-acetylglucosamine:LPS N-acetylglucosamine transferase
LERHAFSSHRLTILIHAGWHNARKVLEIARRLLQEGWPVQAFVVLGKRNPQGWKPPADLVSGESGIRLFDYAQNMDELMAASDLVVCKAGPAMIFEAINLRKPLALLSHLPGQEEGNKRFVLARDFGWYCPSTDTFLKLLHRMLRDPSLLEEKREALERSGIDNGSPQIAGFLMDVLSRGDSPLAGTHRGGA